MKIGIPLSHNAYTPEAYAYEKYLKNLGHQVQLDYELDPNNDINIYFMGMRPLWKKYIGKAVEIHEYQSLSTPPYAKIKNFSKKIINRKPRGRIFLNEIVAQQFSFDDAIPCIYRDMGIDEAFFQFPKDNPEFDIVYSGSISGRIGLIETLVHLSHQYKILVIGSIEGEVKELLLKYNITLTGRVQRSELPSLYANARYGLNYTPDVYPFNIQTSTKTLEYLASGLRVISNRYKWSQYIEKKMDINFIWIDELMGSKKILYSENILINKLDVEEYSWTNILKKSNFDKFLLRFK